jgi:hypothetical protein
MGMTNPRATLMTATDRTCDALAYLQGRLDAARVHGCPLSLAEIAAAVESIRTVARAAWRVSCDLPFVATPFLSDLPCADCGGDEAECGCDPTTAPGQA